MICDIMLILSQVSTRVVSQRPLAHMYHSSTSLTDRNRSTEDAYQKAVTTLFQSLDRAVADLAKSSGPYYFGDNITEADVRLYTVSDCRLLVRYRQQWLTLEKTIIRFDAGMCLPSLFNTLADMVCSICSTFQV